VGAPRGTSGHCDHGRGASPGRARRAIAPEVPLSGSRVRRSLALLRLAAMGGASVGLGCSGPTCEDPVADTHSFSVTRDGAGRLTVTSGGPPDGHTYGSCTELCGDAPAILHVDSCEISKTLPGEMAGTGLDERSHGVWAA
jgi:hypothetical protein